MGLRWEVATTVLHFNVIEDDGYYDLIPFQHPHGVGTQPITYLLDLPFIEFLRADLDFFFELLPEIERPLEIPENDIEIPLWFRALKDDLRDVISVCSLHARLQRSQSARR